jgi:hypothetical protein
MTHLITPLDLEALNSAVAGPVVGPGDGSWDAARQAWNLSADQQPAAVAFPTGTADIQAIVRFAARHGLRVAPQGTGHGAGRMASLQDAILLRTTRMNGVTVDPRARTARAEAGATWNDVLQVALPHGLTALHGSSGGVGVVGYTLGGGLGWLGRRFGLAAGQVTAVELVDADGRLHRCDENDQPEVLWALRGGGGSLGIVTAIEFRLVPVTRAFAGTVVWDADAAPQVLRAWRDWCETAPDDVTSILRWLQLPPIPEVPEPLRGRKVLMLGAVHLGSETQAAADLAPLRRLGTPLFDTFAEVPAEALATLHGDPLHPSPGVGDHRLLAALPDAALDALDAAAGQAAHRLISVELRQLGGRIAAPTQEGAGTRIDEPFALFLLGSPLVGATPGELAEEIDGITAAVAPWCSPRTYLNFAERPTPTRDAFDGDTWARLAAIKAELDPRDAVQSSHPIGD